MWLILFLAVPIFVAEAGTDVLAFFTSKLAEAAEHMSIHDPLMIWSFWLTVAEFMLIVPLLWIGMLNAFYIAIVIFEDLSISKACARFWTLLSQSFSYTSMYMVLMGCVFAPALSLLALLMPIVIFLPQNAFQISTVRYCNNYIAYSSRCALGNHGCNRRRDTLQAIDLRN